LSFRRIIAAQGLAFALAIAGGAGAQDAVPVPTPRPAVPESSAPDIPVPQPRPDGAPKPPAAEPSEPSACRLRLTADIAAVEALPPVAGADGCGVEDPVRLSVVMTKEGKRIPVSPPVTLNCPMAEALAHWLRDDVVDLAATLGAPLTGLTSGQGYQCRGVNGIAGARTSQHGRGNAMDLRAILLANGTSANPTDTALPTEFRERFKASACARFTTVLGPGSDGHHDIYIHLDVAPRRAGYRICQWTVYAAAGAVPLPRERPADAPPRTDAR
jgi:hypothetical protein